MSETGFLEDLPSYNKTNFSRHSKTNLRNTSLFVSTRDYPTQDIESDRRNILLRYMALLEKKAKWCSTDSIDSNDSARDSMDEMIDEAIEKAKRMEMDSLDPSDVDSDSTMDTDSLDPVEEIDLDSLEDVDDDLLEEPNRDPLENMDILFCIQEGEPINPRQ